MFFIAFVFFALAITAICIYKSCDYEIILYIGVFIIVIEILLAIVYTVTYYPAEYACEKKANMMGLKYKFDLYGGCFIHTDEGWFEYNQQRVIR